MWVGPAFKMLFSDYNTRSKSNAVYQANLWGSPRWVTVDVLTVILIGCFTKKLRLSLGSVCLSNKQNFITVLQTTAFVISVRDPSSPDWGQNVPDRVMK